MVNKFISDKRVFNNYKPNFNLLTNLSSSKKILRNYRLKTSPVEEKNTDFFPYFSFGSKNYENSEDDADYFQEKKKISIVTKNKSHEKKIKIFDLNFVKNEIKKISLVKKFDLGDTVTFLENSSEIFNGVKFKKNYTAIGKENNEIHIWETDTLLEEEPLFF